MTAPQLDTSTPARHDAVDPQAVALWSTAGVAAVSKYLIGAAGAAGAVFITAFRTPVLPSNIAQCVVLGLGALALYFGKASPDAVPDGAARWFQSAKVWIAAAAALLTAVAPPIVGLLDTGEWRNLTGPQWLVVVVAVLTAFSAWATPKAEVVTIDAVTGKASNPTNATLEAIHARVVAGQAATITNLVQPVYSDPAEGSAPVTS